MFSSHSPGPKASPEPPTSLLSLGAGVRLALAAILMVALGLAAWWAMLE